MRPGMSSGPFRLRTPGAEVLAGQLEAARHDSFTYREVGESRAAQPPSGYRGERTSVQLGIGPDVFARAALRLRTWAPHRSAGFRLVPPEPALEKDATVLLVLRLPPLWVLAATRILYVIDEPRCFGFAYGTLSMHPERGESAFVVIREDDDQVRFEIQAFSRPAHPLARLGRPVSRAIQRRVTRRYLRAMRREVA